MGMNVVFSEIAFPGNRYVALEHCVINDIVGNSVQFWRLFLFTTHLCVSKGLCVFL